VVCTLDGWKNRWCFQLSKGEGWCCVLVICATGSCRFPFSTLRPAILLLENFNLTVRSSLLSFLLASLSYSCGLAPLAAVACPSTLLPLSYSFLTLPCSIPCREVTFTSLQGALQNLLTRAAGHRSSHWNMKDAVPLRKWREKGGSKTRWGGLPVLCPLCNEFVHLCPQKEKRKKLYELFCSWMGVVRSPRKWNKSTFTVEEISIDKKRNHLLTILEKWPSLYGKRILSHSLLLLF
jgi:hypothetical protein